MRDEDWQERALCARTDDNGVPEHDPETWFAPDGMRNPERKEHYDKARALCATCHVQTACFEYALAERPTDGVWAGVVFRLTNSRQNLLRDRERFVRAVARGKYRPEPVKPEPEPQPEPDTKPLAASTLRKKRAAAKKETSAQRETRVAQLKAMLDSPEWRALEATLNV